jgi:hypothetical protein
MARNIPDEIVVAKLSIEAASVALDALFEKMNGEPRSEKIIATETLQEACKRLKAAQELLSQLEVVAAKEP